MTRTGPHDHAPEGYRFLFQVFDILAESTARAEISRIFGSEKGQAAVFVQGVYRPDNVNTWERGDDLKFRPDGGVMSFLPVSRDWLINQGNR